MRLILRIDYPIVTSRTFVTQFDEAYNWPFTSWCSYYSIGATAVIYSLQVTYVFDYGWVGCIVRKLIIISKLLMIKEEEKEKEEEVVKKEEEEGKKHKEEK